MAHPSKALSMLLSAALIVAQIDGCAQAPKNDRATLLSMEGSDIHTRSFALPESAPPGTGEVLLFGRVYVIEAGSTSVSDLSHNTALFLTAEDAPDKPIPLWPSSAFKRASVPYSPDKDGRFAIIAPAGKHGLQLIYRSAQAGWLAVDTGLRISGEGASGAIYLGDVRILLGPSAGGLLRISSPPSGLTVRLYVSDHFAADYAYLLGNHASLAAVPVESRLLNPSNTHPIVTLSANRTAESEVNSSDGVAKVAESVAVIALFASYIALTVLSAASWTLVHPLPDDDFSRRFGEAAFYSLGALK